MSRTTLILALLSALSLLAVPAAAQEPELHTPCANGQGLPLVTVEEGYSGPLETPVGAGPVAVSTVEGGRYLVDLAGQPVGTTKTIDVVVSWTGPLADVGDYDMVVNGTTYNSTSAGNESAAISRAHCQTITVDEVYVWTGNPTDELTLDVSVSQFSF